MNINYVQKSGKHRYIICHWLLQRCKQVNIRGNQIDGQISGKHDQKMKAEVQDYVYTICMHVTILNQNKWLRFTGSLLAKFENV